MKKTLLFPTDFSIESLQLVKAALAGLDADYSYNIVLLYGYYSSDSITDLLFQSRSRQLASWSNPAFEEALSVLKNKYNSLIFSIRKDVFSDYSQRAFDNYVEANRIDLAFVPEDNRPVDGNRRSFDLTPYFRKCSKVELKTLPLDDTAYSAERGKLSALFANSVSTN